jgi:hypothetical protein
MSTTTDERLIERMASAFDDLTKRLDDRADDMSDPLRAIALCVEGIRATAATTSD